MRTFDQGFFFKIEQNPDITLQQIAVVYQRLVNVKHDSTMIQQSLLSKRSPVKTVQSQRSTTPPGTTDKKHPSTFWNCGGWHFVRYCPFELHHCRNVSEWHTNRNSAPHHGANEHTTQQPHKYGSGLENTDQQYW